LKTLLRRGFFAGRLEPPANLTRHTEVAVSLLTLIVPLKRAAQPGEHRNADRVLRRLRRRGVLAQTQARHAADLFSITLLESKPDEVAMVVDLPGLADYP